VEVAARLFRERGVAQVSVADVMAEAGLTHGGFYKQFTSKDALAVEALAALLAGLVGYLRARGDWEAASREIGVHRHTMRSRIARESEILQADLNDPDAFSELWLALRIAGYA
jgi:AcrR family transcriptional regulator